MRVMAWLFAGAIYALLPGSVQGQSRATTADLNGIVRDQTGAIVPGAQVSVIEKETNLERLTVSQQDGRFSVPALAPGRYTVRVALPGFATQVFDDVDLLLGTSLDLDAVLPVASVGEQIVVDAETPLLDTQRTAITTAVSEAQLDYLPINGRNFVALSLITPGVTVDRVPQQGAAAGSGLTFVGQRARANNITVDGLDNNDGTLGSVRALFSQDAIAEFQVVAHSYAAEFGKASGGVINIVTKSGTNALAGSAFVLLRDENLNAKEYFERFDAAGRAIDLAKAPYGQKQFGGIVGGPVKRDRTFYFASYERLSVNANNFVTIDGTRPVDLFGRSVGTVVDLLRGAGFPVETGYVPYAVRSNTLLAKIDHRFQPTRVLTVRYNYAANFNGNIDPFGGLVAHSRGGEIESTDHMAAGAYLTVHERTVNELRAQIARRDQSIFPLDPTCNGKCDRDDEGGATVEIGGVANVGRNRIYPQLRENVRYQMLDTMTRLTGAHELKGGVDFNWIEHPHTTLPLHYGGRYIFVPLPQIPGLLPAPVSAVQAFALGLPGAYIQGYGKSDLVYGSGDVSLFVQDSWRLRPNLTVKAGVRYQRQFWRNVAFDVPELGRYDFPADRNDLAPRLAVAWKHARTTTIHAAYGVFHENQISSLAAIADIVDGSREGTRTLVLRFPQTLAAWQAPGRRLPEPSTPYPSLMFSVDPNLKTPYAHHASIGLDRALPGELRLSVDGVFVRGFEQPAALDYNPLVPQMGANRRPLDVGGVPGTSASILQYTSFGRTWYRGLMISLNKRFDSRYQLLASYALSRAEDTSSDFQSSVLPQITGRGRNPQDPDGLPLGVNPLAEKGPALHDQRHQLVVSGTFVAPGAVYLSAIVTTASGAAYNVLAGADLNGDGDGGAFSSDRARRNPSDPASTLSRNTGRLPAQVTVDLRGSRGLSLNASGHVELLVEVFNLFNRANFTEVNNIFGTGAFPDNPLPTYGQFQRSAPPRQVQIGARLRF